MRVNFRNRGKQGKKEIKGMNYTCALLETAFRLGNTSPARVKPCGSSLILEIENGKIIASVESFSKAFLFANAGNIKGVYKNAFEYTLI